MTTTPNLDISLGDFIALDTAARKQMFVELSIQQRIAYIEAFCEFDPLEITGKALMENQEHDPLAQILSASDRTKIQSAGFVQSQVRQSSDSGATKLTVIEGGKQ